MSASNAARACAIVLILINALSGSAHAAAYALWNPALGGQAGRTGSPVEPFGRQTSPLSGGPLRAKWQDVERSIAAEAEIIAACARDPHGCTSRPALRFLEIVGAASAREGLARLGEINRAFNLAIRPVSDRTQYGVDDYWSPPLATLAAGAGDCEDYAIAKLVALRAAGVAEDDLRLVIIREAASGDDHAVVAARVDGHWRVLDNRSFVMLEDRGFDKYLPLFVIDAEGVKRFEQPMYAARGTQAQPAEIDTPDHITGMTMPEIGLTAGTAAFDEFCRTLAM